MATERKMSAKGFLHRASGKVSAEAFLKQHRVWLTTGDLAVFTSPILNKLDEGTVLPTPCLEAIKNVVVAHHLADEIRKSEAAMNRANEPKASKLFIATVYNAEGQIQTHTTESGKVQDLIKDFERAADAERWADRKLFDGCSDWYAVVASTKMFDSDGQALSTVVLRDSAISRILKEKKSAVLQRKPQNSKLSFGVKAKQSTAHFSHG